ncbi:MAG: serine protein kinase RIO [Candidatus Lokiarchaeota archaeon]|nr:serine protein kinase RIO [Candidatus Lokiarchaeota archaeon]
MVTEQGRAFIVEGRSRARAWPVSSTFIAPVQLDPVMPRDQLDDMLARKVDERRERIKDASDRKAQEAVMSPRVSKILFNLQAKGTIQKLVGIINAGKEANVYNAIGAGGRELAIKIFRVNSQTSKWMHDYIAGDPRFARYRKKNSQVLMNTWALKEFKNLKRAREAGVPCPEPVAVVENVLVMEFIGKNGTPARRLTEVELADPVKHLNAILQGMANLITKARLVHGDLSAFNILHNAGDDQVYFIDFAQGVLMDHPNSRKYFDRDVDNILGYFAGILPDDLDREALVDSIIAGKPARIG